MRKAEQLVMFMANFLVKGKITTRQRLSRYISSDHKEKRKSQIRN